MSCADCSKVQGAVKIGMAALRIGVVPGVVAEARYSQCLECPHRKPGMLNYPMCDLCGCFIGAKIRLANEQCPDSPPRWIAHLNK